MLLSVHVTSVLFLVQFNNSTLADYGILLELHALTLVTRSYALLTRLQIHHCCLSRLSGVSYQFFDLLMCNFLNESGRLRAGVSAIPKGIPTREWYTVNNRLMMSHV